MKPSRLLSRYSSAQIHSSNHSVVPRVSYISHAPTTRSSRTNGMATGLRTTGELRGSGGYGPALDATYPTSDRLPARGRHAGAARGRLGAERRRRAVRGPVRERGAGAARADGDARAAGTVGRRGRAAGARAGADRAGDGG